MSRRKLRSIPVSAATPPEPSALPSGLMGDVEPAAATLGETFRRVALGLTGALIVARAYWPAEFRSEADSGTSLLWSLMMLVTAVIAVAGMWLEGGLRLRRSWADLGVVALFGLVALSATHAADRRIAINFAWEWIAVGLAYLLLRNLPRHRAESSALAGILVATAVAVSVYGLYQSVVEMPEARAFFRANPREAMRRAGLDPNADAIQVKRFADRLIGSREPVATFALTNTLAGFLVGPMILGLCVFLRGIARRPATSSPSDELAESADARAGLFFLISPALLAVLLCFLLTKSRSAYLGLLVALALFAWRERRRVSSRTIALVGLGLTGTLAVLVAVAAMAGQLDRQVLTESTKSLTYRAEYWRGAWGVIWYGPSRWWSGLGPGNFAGPYLQHKLPQASEEITDPHNFVLEVWATAGLPAVVAMLFALGFGLREIFGRTNSSQAVASSAHDDEPDAPYSTTWLVVSAGLGGSLLAIVLVRINPFDPESASRLLILTVSWGLAATIGRQLWNRAPIAAEALGLGVVAIVVNLLAAGGIGFAPVSLMLWGMLALGQNLREDRRSGLRRPFGGRELTFAVGACLAAVLGTYIGTVLPFFRAQSAMSAAETALMGVTADAKRADDLYRQAAEADRYGSRARIARANLEGLEWRRRGRPSDDFTWHRIDSGLKSARTRPRDPKSLLAQRLRAAWAREFLELPNLVEGERYRIRIDRRDACRKACILYPTDSSLRAEFAEALADLELYPEAVEQAWFALKLSDLTPHADKKLREDVREHLTRMIPKWEVAKPTPPPKPSKS
ncbi:MAG: lipid core-O-antigen ligase-like enyme [Planctomycetota bacterium]|nr:lipid core-O-antigen ligase-like enyme [Planctomycetota bacterium]